jgi:hypothetical protein
MKHAKIHQDFKSIIDSCWFEKPFSYEIKDDHLVVTTSNLHDNVVQSYFDQIYLSSNHFLNLQYKVVEMLLDYDGDLEDEGRELCDHNSISYREWKVIPLFYDMNPPPPKTFIWITSDKQAVLFHADSLEDAKHIVINICDHSQENIIREIESLCNNTEIDDSYIQNFNLEK